MNEGPSRETVSDLAGRIAALPRDRGRPIIAIAGPPASGKSTLAADIVTELQAMGHRAALVPMDGFHLDNAVLEQRGLLARKGAPETFDAAGFVNAMSRLRAGGEVILPSFDRDLEKSIAGSIVVADDIEIVVVEGNYLLLEAQPWSALSDIWALTVYLDVPEAELEARLMARWRRYRYSEEDAYRKTHENDLPNARTVMATADRAEIVVEDRAKTGDRA